MMLEKIPHITMKYNPSGSPDLGMTGMGCVSFTDEN
jgi:hypothetical protein